MKQILILLILLVPVITLTAHGSEYNILSDKTLKIEAKFDTGEPIANSPVLVFSPGGSEPQYILETDEEGIFYFAPDKVGTWILQVRGNDGHGMRINIPVDENLISTPPQSSSISLMQKVFMAISIIWGAIGTALYFKKRR